MPDNGTKAAPGQRVRMPAEVFNNILDMSAAWQAGRSLTQQSINTGPGPRIQIYNRSLDVIDWYGIVGIHKALVNPNIDEAMFMSTPGFTSDDPAPGEPFAILQDAALPNTVVPAVMSGESPALVLMNDVTDKFAEPIASDYDKLSSSSLATSCEILWSSIPASTTLNGGINDTVTSLIVASTRAFKLAPFTVLIEDEEIRVTAVDQVTKTWTVTRGYNGTTAASHADGETVTFKSGVVWGIVRIGSTAAEEDNLALILSAIEVFG